MVQALTTEAQVRQALEGVMDPELHKSLIELGMVREVRVEEAQVYITLALTTLGCPLKDQIVRDVKETTGAVDGVEGVHVELTEMTDEEKRRIGIGVPNDGRGAVEDLPALAGTATEDVLSLVKYQNLTNQRIASGHSFERKPHSA